MDHDKALCSFLLGYDVMCIYGTYENLISAIFNSSIPPDLLLIKLFEYIIYKGKTIDDLYQMLSGDISDFNKMNEDTESIQKFMKIISDRHPTFIPYDEKVCDQLGSLFQIKNIKKDNVEHSGQPCVDPMKGRPHLNWNRCCYPKCGKTFQTAMSLVNHLISCNSYSQGYHFWHEIAVNETFITPEYVLEKKLTVCPSYACNHKDFASPEELIDHLIKLGIEPCWKQGTIINYDETINDKRSLLYTIPKLFCIDDCVLCLSEKPQVIMSNCRHNAYCLECYKTVCEQKGTNTNHVCPMCKCNVDTYYPFAI